jgi:hypothetical protein
MTAATAANLWPAAVAVLLMVMLMQTKEYKSVYRTFSPGDQYMSAEYILNEQAADGWELVCVTIAQGVNWNLQYEIFYLVREIKTSEELPT